MNAETLKDSLIYALNLGVADDFLESVCDCFHPLDAGPEKFAESVLDMLMEVRRMIREHQYALRRSAALQRETDAMNRAEEARRARDGLYTDEEGDEEILRDRARSVRRAA